MKTIKLKILAEDIRELNYGNPNKCPITKALARAGYPHLRDEGMNIVENFNDTVYRYSQRDLDTLQTKMFGMMNSLGAQMRDANGIVPAIPVEDIEFTFEI